MCVTSCCCSAIFVVVILMTRLSGFVRFRSLSFCFAMLLRLLGCIVGARFSFQRHCCFCCCSYGFCCRNIVLRGWFNYPLIFVSYAVRVRCLPTTLTPRQHISTQMRIYSYIYVCTYTYIYNISIINYMPHSKCLCTCLPHVVSQNNTNPTQTASTTKRNVKRQQKIRLPTTHPFFFKALHHIGWSCNMRGRAGHTQHSHLAYRTCNVAQAPSHV